MKAIILAALLFSTVNVYAHEGHNEAPGSVKAFHGGTVKTGKELNLEIVTAAGELKVFPLAHGGSDIPMSEVKLTGSAQPPKGKPFPVSFIEKDGAFYTKLDFKGAYRLTVELKAAYKGKTDTIKVQVEQ